VCDCAVDAVCQRAIGPAATCNRISGVCDCVPACSGRACGPDGCGGTCPNHCAADEDCNASGQCFLPFCGMGGTVDCGNGTFCPPHSRCNGGMCTCDSGRGVTCAGQACNGPCVYPDWRCL
jgi:hypothetical protein